MHPESRYLTSQRLKLHYVIWGDEANPPLFLVHGSRDHARSWDRTAQALADRYCVYAPDLRGHGDSEWSIGSDYSIIDYALDLHALGEHIGRPPYTIVGHSLGGGVSLQYAGTFPEKVKRLVTIEGLGRLGDPREHKPAHVRMREWIESMHGLEARKPHTYPTIEAATERMVAANRRLTPELAHHLTIHGVRGEPGSYAWKYDNFTRAGSPYEFNMEDARDLWNQVRCPILIVWGNDSGRVGRRHAIDLSPFHDYRSVRIADAGHWVHHDQFDAFMQLVNGFLAE